MTYLGSLEDSKDSVVQPLLEKIEVLEKEIESLKKNSEIIISDRGAKFIVEEVIESLKAQGVEEVDIIDLYTKTNLPLKQINRVVEEMGMEDFLEDI